MVLPVQVARRAGQLPDESVTWGWPQTSRHTPATPTLAWMDRGGGALALTKDVPAMRRLTRNKDASELFAPHIFRLDHRNEGAVA